MKNHKNIVDMCYAEALEVPLLTREEEIELAKKIEAGDASAISKMAEANQRYVISIAKKFYTKYKFPGVSLEDYVQEGNLGLLKAIQKFDYTRGYRFSTMATDWIKQGIGRYIKKQGGIKIPEHKHSEINQVYKICQKFTEDYGCEATPEEIADITGMTVKKVKEILSIPRTSVSLNAEIGDDGGTFANLIEDKKSINPEEALMNNMLSDKLAEAMKVLTSIEEQVMTLRYGIDDGITRTLAEVGQIMNGVSRQRIHDVHTKALEKLREALVPAPI
jgi:RNA polymerase primary sigma factor